MRKMNFKYRFKLIYSNFQKLIVISIQKNGQSSQSNFLETKGKA